MTTLPVEPAAVGQLVSGYFNSDPVGPSNPGGLADDGHVDNFPAALAAVGVASAYVGATAAVVAGIGEAAGVTGDKIDDLNGRLFIQAADPGAVGAGKVWAGADGILRVRGPANDTWSAIVLPAGASEAVAGLVRMATAVEARTWAADNLAISPKQARGLLGRGTLSRAGDVQLVAADLGRQVVATGTFTQTVAACAGLGDGWHLRYRNAGTGVITIDPNGAETINGAATMKIFGGEAYDLTGDGAALSAVMVSPAIPGPPAVRTANTPFGAADNGGVFMLSGTWTQTYVSGAGLPPNWRVRTLVTAGLVTHDPAGAETIGGLTTAAQRPGDVWDIIWTGAEFVLHRLAGANFALLTSGTSWMPEAGVYDVWVEGVGGGGGAVQSTTHDAGGGSGARVEGRVAVTPGVPVPISIGAPGVDGDSAASTSGTNGGNTQFGPLVAGGGKGAPSSFSGGDGGTATGGDINVPGQPGRSVSVGGSNREAVPGVVPGGRLSGLYGTGSRLANAQQGAIFVWWR